MNDTTSPLKSDSLGPAWTYHALPSDVSSRPKGRTLRLLAASEAASPQVRDLLSRMIGNTYNQIEKTEWFTSQFLNGTPTLTVTFRQLMRETEPTKSKPLPQETALHSLNVCLNSIFSDSGWKLVRRRISQIERVQKTTRPVISKNQYDKLVLFKDTIGAKSVDAAIDELLSFYKDEHPAFSADREALGELINYE
ncbi:hypothetical protein FJD32_023760 (plasmid) [Shewanella sp. LC6]|uniref:Uncharacterized protein n=1 Tax=Shewanella xiamenensis TaxID=332186 RepID=A0AAE4Q5F2_9GAMM|nr:MULTISPECIES: hypothetical protein [Shewanella]ABK50590.1 conserved hypothetical protein [Shewanella sp. ANA-3]MCB2384724.1 hypothetical protein [Shewanella sp. SR1]MDV5393049.1 hypothetical protein [Shewanella xiamenensis]QQK62407.1 hypothetical protein FJD32_023760 [Shewanella sp. LC6]TPE58422.1 hypothetical protein FJD33_09995 [Shewanella sp. LC2]